MCFPSFHHSLQPASASLIPQTQHLAPITIAIASYMGSFILVQVSMEILQNNVNPRSHYKYKNRSTIDKVNKKL